VKFKVSPNATALKMSHNKPPTAALENHFIKHPPGMS
jgi:hypothetical protein